MFGIKSAFKRLGRNEKNILGAPARKNCVNLEWWSEKTNVGDSLSPVIVQWICEQKGIDPTAPVKGTRHLFALGSVLGMGKCDAVIWGSGIHCMAAAETVAGQRNWRRYDIRAVRGPVTALLLRMAGYRCPQIYGDPGILMPLIYQPQTSEQHPVTLIRHYISLGNEVEGIHCLNPDTQDYKAFLTDLCASEKIISSSLHGIILAEAYGIPAVWLIEGVEDQRMKYLDWYYSTGRYNVRFAENIEQALTIEPMALPDLSKMQKALLDSFPADMYVN